MPSPAKTSEASLVVRGLIDRLVDLLASFFGGSLGIEFILRRLDRLVDLLTSLLDRSFRAHTQRLPARRPAPETRYQDL